ncbi:putative quinol monooxygenase [Spirosoma koreense]
MKSFKTVYQEHFCLTNLVATFFTLFMLTFSSGQEAMAQDKNQMVRLAKINVDPAQLKSYNAALKEQMTTAVRVEPGVLTYYAVADKKDPSSITILEIYADTAAYNAHVTTPHFKKYKETVKDMVKSLELVDVNLVGSAKKPGL